MFIDSGLQNNALFFKLGGMKRAALHRLLEWLDEPGRRPLVLRGARQVGKTWLVRELARAAGRELVEINFERDPGLKRLFASNDPRRILGELSLALGRDIAAESSLLFLDEIQAAGEVLASLRWFFEALPILPVVAAGSLLEFTLAEHSFSMPVGRVAFRHIEPMGFSEYLEAHGQDVLLRTLHAWRTSEMLSPVAHERATHWFQRYAMVGGMPAVVAIDVAGEAPRRCRELQRELVATFRADFAKYRGRMDQSVLDTVLRAVAGSLGQKFVYAQSGDGIKQHQSKRALELLASARLCHLVRYSAAHGVPLGAQVKDTFRKAVLLDVGLLHALVGTPADQVFPEVGALPPALRGQIADQLLGQQLRLSDDAVGDGPELYYWQREGGRPGEIDYLVQRDAQIIPIELKAGAAGAMKSLHQFMFDRSLPRAVRVDTNPPSTVTLSVQTTQQNQVTYRLISVPAYLVWNLAIILREDSESQRAHS